VPLGYARGGVKKQMTKVTYICRSPKKQVVILFIFIFILLYFYRVFGRFVARGLLPKKKQHLGSSQKVRLFFPSPRPVVLLDFFLSRFWAFRDKWSSKTR
jgi:hypothetical protein